MKIPNAVLVLVLTLAATVHADDATLDALCASGEGKMKRVAISGVQRLDCGGEKVSWFQVRSPNGNLVGHYEATRNMAWRPAVEAAVADLAVVCGELPPQIQFAQRKLIADCGSDRK